MKKPVVLGVLFLVGMLGLIIYSTLPSSGYRVSVCLNFKGRGEICKTVSGATEESAVRNAIDNACGEIASGVTDTVACHNVTPTSITWLTRGDKK